MEAVNGQFIRPEPRFKRSATPIPGMLGKVAFVFTGGFKNFKGERFRRRELIGTDDIRDCGVA